MTLRDLEGAGEVLGAAVAAGGDAARLGGVRETVQGAPPGPLPFGADTAASSVPLSPGSEQVSVTVDITWGLD